MNTDPSSVSGSLSPIPWSTSHTVRSTTLGLRIARHHVDKEATSEYFYESDLLDHFIVYLPLENSSRSRWTMSVKTGKYQIAMDFYTFFWKVQQRLSKLKLANVFRNRFSEVVFADPREEVLG